MDRAIGTHVENVPEKFLAKIFQSFLNFQRYLSQVDTTENEDRDLLSLPGTRNLVVILTVAFEGESADLENNLADAEALEYGLKALINLHYQKKLRAIQIHFSPAKLGDELNGEQLLLNFPELIPF